MSSSCFLPKTKLHTNRSARSTNQRPSFIGEKQLKLMFLCGSLKKLTLNICSVHTGCFWDISSIFLRTIQNYKFNNKISFSLTGQIICLGLWYVILCQLQIHPTSNFIVHHICSTRKHIQIFYPEQVIVLSINLEKSAI